MSGFFVIKYIAVKRLKKYFCYVTINQKERIYNFVGKFLNIIIKNVRADQL